MDYRIKDIPQEERPRERLLIYGAGALSNTELLAIILRTGTKGESALALATRILRDYGLRALAKASAQELTKIRGISHAKACQIAACFELGRRVASIGAETKIKISSPADAYNLLADLSHLNQEVFCILLLNSKNQLISREEVFKGGWTSSLVEPQEVFRRALVKGASRIILAHNHPSGDPEPSGEDIEITKRLKRAGDIIGIEVLDHIIIGDAGYVSLKEKGLL